MIFVPKNKRGGGWRGRKTLNGYASSKPLNNQIAKFAIDLFNGRQLENEFRLNSEQFFFPLFLSPFLSDCSVSEFLKPTVTFEPRVHDEARLGQELIR